MYYFLTASKDASIFQQQPTQNTGLDEVLEVSKVDYPFPNKNTFTSKKMTEDTLKLYYQLFNRSS